MTIFIVSIFLPYTVNFDTGADNVHASLPEMAQPSSVTERKLSLLSDNAGKIVQTPGATTDLECIFTPPPPKHFKLCLPLPQKEEGSDQDPAGKVETKMHHRHSSTISVNRDPRLLARTDLHSPAWGSFSNFNQPISRAKSPPPVSVLKHNAQVTSLPNLPWKKRARARTFSNEKHFNEHNFFIEKAQRGNGGLFNVIDAVSDSGVLVDKTWVGTLGMPTDALSDHLRETISETLEDEFQSLVVYVQDSDFDGHYKRYCETILWPIFHYQVPDHPRSKAYEDHSWVFYKKVNEAFAARIYKNYKKGDIIWIHDHHLLLVPGMLRAKIPDAQIGFFMHTAFPSSEIFRCLATRTELLEGLLGSNMIGFQNSEYGHHFLQTCSRLLTVEAKTHGVLLEDGGFVHVGTFPIGIDPKGFEERRSLPEVGEWIQKIGEKYSGKRLLVARDQLDSIRGVRQKLLAYELFLNRHPEYRDDVVLIQIATTAPNEQPELSMTIGDIVTRINSTHATLSHQPLVYLRQDIDHSQYLALCTVAEIGMVTSLREGMNLTSHEFICCQDGKYSKNRHSPLVLSEFTGSAVVLGHDALLVNPWDYREVANAIKTALDMSSEERKVRWEAMFESVNRQNAASWYNSFIKALSHAHEEHSSRDTTAVPRLSFPNLKSKYDAAGRRLIILDYEGTLASWGTPNSIALTTPQRAIDVLNSLLEDWRNIVYVMSERTPEEVESLFCLVPSVGLIAENGSLVREPSMDDWVELFDVKHVKSWKPGVRQILQYYVERIERSRVKDRHSGLILDYSDNDEDSNGVQLAAECANHLSDACHSQKIHVITIENGLCISGFANKGTACKWIWDNLARLAEKGNAATPDFLLVIGDSREDEDAFNWAQDLEQTGTTIRDVCTVTLGTRSTSATATLTQGVTGVLSTLRKLAST
ncbi:hypothetical protein DV736_g5048, partial [Chaetothyriales sp. CBS 134916]